MTKRRVAEIYRFLAQASMKRMQDDEKIALIRLLRTMKPVSNEVSEAIIDAQMRAVQEGVSDPPKFAMEAVADLAEQEVKFIIKVMSEETFERLMLSNDWTFGQIDELHDELVEVKN